MGPRLTMRLHQTVATVEFQVGERRTDFVEPDRSIARHQGWGPKLRISLFRQAVGARSAAQQGFDRSQRLLRGRRVWSVVIGA